MLFVRFLCAYGVLFSLSLFINSNLGSLGAGSGYGFLAIALICFVAMIVLPGELSHLIRIKKSTLFFLAFIAYFGVKFFFESEDPDQTKQILVGTTGGVIFAIGIGFMCGHAFSTIYELRFRVSTSQIVVVGGFVYFLLVLFLSWGALQNHLGQVRGDLFLIEEQEGFYQRAGALACMQVMLVVSLATILFASFRRIGLTPAVLIIPIILVTGALTSLMSQLIGSNSGMVTSVAFIFIFIVNLVTMSMGGQRGYQSIELSNVVFGPLGGRILVGTLVAGSLVLVAGVGAVKVLGIDPSSLRIAGFGTGAISSVETRSEVFQDNFVRHLEHSPVFGNTQVELLTTGEGTYVHSLLSVLTHLGFFGAAIFVAAVFWVYVEIVTPQRSRDVSLYASKRYGLFRLMMLSAVIVMCLYSAFFTWMPLWFALGLFADWHYRT